MSLPYNMRGSVAITDISDVITELAMAEVNLGDDEPGVSLPQRGKVVCSSRHLCSVALMGFLYLLQCVYTLLRVLYVSRTVL